MDPRSLTIATFRFATFPLRVFLAGFRRQYSYPIRGKIVTYMLGLLWCQTVVVALRPMYERGPHSERREPVQ